MELNLTNLRDLEFICEAAASYFESTGLMPGWQARANHYRKLFGDELDKEREKETQCTTNTNTL